MILNLASANSYYGNWKHLQGGYEVGFSCEVCCVFKKESCFVHKPSSVVHDVIKAAVL